MMKTLFLLLIIATKGSSTRCLSFSFSSSSSFTPTHVSVKSTHYRRQSLLFPSASSFAPLYATSTKNNANNDNNSGSSISKDTTIGFSSSSNIASYEEAMAIIDRCSTSSTPCDELYNAVKYIDKNANTIIYPDVSSREKMWDTAHGSWKLVLATGGGRYTTFKPVPIFAFARIDGSTFGNGVGLNGDWILLSLLGPHEFSARTRQMKICIDDMYIAGKEVTDKVPSFITKGIGLGKRPGDYSGVKGDRIPAFTIIASSEESLVARGGTGGIAIWTRLDKDISSAAYGN